MLSPVRADHGFNAQQDAPELVHPGDGHGHDPVGHDRAATR